MTADVPAEQEAVALSEPDPVGDIAETVGHLHDCGDPRACKECREAATLVWTNSPGHREAWWSAAHKRLADAVVDLCWRVTPYGHTEDGDIAHYLVTKGTVHRLIGAAQGAGIAASFRNSDEPITDDEDADRLAAAVQRGREEALGEGGRDEWAVDYAHKVGGTWRNGWLPGYASRETAEKAAASLQDGKVKHRRVTEWASAPAATDEGGEG